jgi:hypothetical protein
VRGEQKPEARSQKPEEKAKSEDESQKLEEKARATAGAARHLQVSPTDPVFVLDLSSGFWLLASPFLLASGFWLLACLLFWLLACLLFWLLACLLFWLLACLLFPPESVPPIDPASNSAILPAKRCHRAEADVKICQLIES